MLSFPLGSVAAKVYPVIDEAFPMCACLHQECSWGPDTLDGLKDWGSNLPLVIVFLVPSPLKAEQQQQQNGQHDGNSICGSGSSGGASQLDPPTSAVSGPPPQPPHLSLLVLLQAERLTATACSLLTSSINKKTVTAAPLSNGSRPVLLHLDPHNAAPAEHCLDPGPLQQHCQAEFKGAPHLSNSAVFCLVGICRSMILLSASLRLSI